MLEIPRSTIYYKNKPKLPDLNLECEVIGIFKDSKGNYGTRKIQVKLKEKGLIASRRKIGQVMKKHGLVSNYNKGGPKPGKTHCNEDDCPNIVDRDFKRDDSLDVVVSDLTYVKVDNIWCYICLIIDLWNREIVGYAAGRHKSAELVYQAFESIPYDKNKINIFHTDRGSEFKNQLIDELIDKYHLKRSLSHKGTPLDNAVVESTNHILKTEFIYQHRFKSLHELQLLLFDYIHWYNHERIHGTLNYLTPIEYRRKYGEVAGANIVYNASFKNCAKKC